MAETPLVGTLGLSAEPSVSPALRPIHLARRGTPGRLVAKPCDRPAPMRFLAVPVFSGSLADPHRPRGASTSRGFPVSVCELGRRGVRVSTNGNPTTERWVLVRWPPGTVRARIPADASALLRRAELRAPRTRDVSPLSHHPGPFRNLRRSHGGGGRPTWAPGVRDAGVRGLPSVWEPGPWRRPGPL